MRRSRSSLKLFNNHFLFPNKLNHKISITLMIHILMTTFSFDSTELLHLFLPNNDTGTNTKLPIFFISASLLVLLWSSLFSSLSMLSLRASWNGNSSNQVGIFLDNFSTGCPQKNRDLWEIVTVGHLVELEKKVGPFLKNSGNSLSDRHQNFSIWPYRSWENWV